MKKKEKVVFFMLIFGLSSCIIQKQIITQPPREIRIKVTRIVQISLTPIPRNTSTPTPTLQPIDSVRTQTAELIGTPIVADSSCFLTAYTQAEINSCSISRKNEMEKQMVWLITTIEENGYPYDSNQDLKNIFTISNRLGRFYKTRMCISVWIKHCGKQW